MFIFPFIYSVLTYWTIGYEADFDRFLFFAFTICLLVTCASSYGMFFGAAFRQAATTATSLAMMPIMLFGGFYANVSTMPDWIMWV